MKRKYSFFFGALFLILSCKNKVNTTFPVEEKISVSVYANGIIKSKNQYQVYATVSGLLSNIYIQKGAKVKKGAALFKITNTALQYNIENASLAANYAAVAANTEKLKELQATINLARSNMEHEASLLERQKNLWSQQIGTKNEMDLRELTYKSAKTNYETAKARYTSLEKQLRFQEAQTRNNLNLSKSASSDYIIKSEINGTVYNILKEKGELVQPQSPIALIGSDTNFILELQVDEYDIAKIKAGQLIAVQMDSYKGEVFEAIVQFIDPIMNEKTKSFTVDAIFTKQPPTLYPNLSCEANILITTKEKALTIPRSYLQEGEHVIVNKKEKRKVTIGLMDFQKVEITGGLTIKDKIYQSEK